MSSPSDMDCQIGILLCDSWSRRNRKAEYDYMPREMKTSVEFANRVIGFASYIQSLSLFQALQICSLQAVCPVAVEPLGKEE